jgi:hypothetical protein
MGGETDGDIRGKTAWETREREIREDRGNDTGDREDTVRAKVVGKKHRRRDSG